MPPTCSSTASDRRAEKADFDQREKPALSAQRYENLTPFLRVSRGQCEACGAQGVVDGASPSDTQGKASGAKAHDWKECAFAPDATPGGEDGGRSQATRPSAVASLPDGVSRKKTRGATALRGGFGRHEPPQNRQGR